MGSDSKRRVGVSAAEADSLELRKVTQKSQRRPGASHMTLPFEPMVLTFQDIRYIVPNQAVRHCTWLLVALFVRTWGLGFRQKSNPHIYPNDTVALQLKPQPEIKGLVLKTLGLFSIPCEAHWNGPHHR